MNPVLHFNMMKRRSRIGLMCSLAAVSVMVLLGLTDASWGRWMVYLATCAAMVFAIYQVPGTSRVSLDPYGISIHSPFWRQRLDWRNLRGFVLIDLNRNGLAPSPRRCWIGYLMNDHQREATPQEMLNVFAPLGCDGLLPRVENVDPSELVRLLNGVLRARLSAKGK